MYDGWSSWEVREICLHIDSDAFTQSLAEELAKPYARKRLHSLEHNLEIAADEFHDAFLQTWESIIKPDDSDSEPNWRQVAEHFIGLEYESIKE